jgi:hypothetical protein
MLDVKTIDKPAPGAGYQKLNAFVGRWSRRGQTTMTSGEAMIITGTDCYQWLPGGYFVLHQWDVRVGSQESKGIEVIGYDEKTRSYPTYSFDSLGNMGAYQASIREDVWAFRSRSQRATVVFSDNGDTITLNWEHLVDGINWEPAMEIKLKRAS